jgi:hypothetical protein
MSDVQADEVLEPADQEGNFLRDPKNESYYFHFSALHTVAIFIALADQIHNHAGAHFRPMADEMKKQLAAQGIDWKLMSELVDARVADLGLTPKPKDGPS